MDRPDRTETPASPQAVYAELRRQLRLRVRLPVYQRRLARAEARIHAAVAAGSAAVMFSGGKDSTALVHLTKTLYPDTPAFFFDCGAETPWTYEVIELMGERYDITVLETVVSMIDMLKHIGWRGYDGPDRREGEWHWSPRQMREVLIEEPARRVRAMGYAVHILGLRGPESPGRAMNARSRGALYTKADGTTIAAPLCDWEADDVLAYIVTHDLPLSDVYLQPDDAERGDRRSAPALLTYQVSYGGAWARLREQQPALWQELTRIFPDMRRDA